MTTKVEIIIDNLEDATAFDAALPDILAKAGALPDLVALESSRVWPKDDGSATPPTAPSCSRSPATTRPPRPPRPRRAARSSAP